MWKINSQLWSEMEWVCKCKSWRGDKKLYGRDS